MFFRRLIYNIINIATVVLLIALYIFLYQISTSEIKLIVKIFYSIMYFIFFIISINNITNLSKSWFRRQVIYENEKIFNSKNMQVIRKKNQGSLQDGELSLFPVFNEEYKNKKRYKIKNKFKTILNGSVLSGSLSFKQTKVSVDLFEYKLYKDRILDNNFDYHDHKGEAFIFEFDNLFFSREPCIFYSTKFHDSLWEDIDININNKEKIETGFLYYHIDEGRKKVLQIEIIKQINEKIPQEKLGIIIFNKNRFIYLTPEKYAHELKVKLPFILTARGLKKVFKEQEEDLEKYTQMITELTNLLADIEKNHKI